jgi:acetyl-CoA synthetase
MDDVLWTPTPEYVERANVTRFMRVHGIETYPQLVAGSIGDPEWFWDAVVKDLGISFLEPYERVLDTSKGVEWATWFVGGRTNVAHQCVDIWAARTPEAVAVIWEGEDGDVRRVTYRELRELTDRARLLSRRVAKGCFLETPQRLEQIHKKLRTDWTAMIFWFPVIHL